MRRLLVRAFCVTLACTSIGGCATNTAGENIAIGLGVLLGAAVVAKAAKHGAFGNGGQSANDWDWDWDEFYNQNHQLVWACRGVQTGRFADQYHCNGKPQTDLRWPNK